MQDIIYILYIVLRMMLTRYGIIFWFIIIVLYGAFLFGLCKRHVTVSIIGKLLGYSFAGEYGALLMALAYMTNRQDLYYIGLFIFLAIPLFDALQTK